MALRRKPVRYERVLVVSLGGRGSSIPTPTWGVLVCTCQHWYGTGQKTYRDLLGRGKNPNRIEVFGECVEAACSATRTVPSFLRVGSFELLSLPASLFFIGGCQQSPYWEGLHLLGEWVGRGMLRLEGVEWGGENRTVWGKKLVLEVLEKGREDRCWHWGHRPTYPVGKC